jgi:purine-nucleoside phosphorylase
VTDTAAAQFLRARLRTKPRVALVLGSGLGALADEVTDPETVDFAEVPGFARSAVAGHKGRIVAGILENVPCLIMQGRYHMYEGHSAATVAVPVRAAAQLGAEILIVTNAAGGMNPGFRAGDLMIIDDHINLMWRNPLIGPVIPGDLRFPDMSEPYDRDLQALAQRVAAERRIHAVSGTYVGLLGPSYETPAEIRLYRRYGDAIGMSTVPEVIAARAIGMRCLGLSVISNLAAGMSQEMLTHEDVLVAGQTAAVALNTLLRGILSELHRQWKGDS